MTKTQVGLGETSRCMSAFGSGPGPFGKIAVVLAATLALGGCDGTAAKTDQQHAVSRPAATVSVAPARRELMVDTVTATGTVSAWQEIVIGAQTSGLAVVEVRIRENDAVHAGDLLVRLENRSLSAQVAQQKAVIAEARATLDSAKQESARADLLVAQKAMSLETVETRRTAIRTSQAKLDQALASLDQLQTSLDQTTVRAPADGVVAQAPVVLGAIVQVGTELVRLVRDGRLEVQAKVPERDLGRIRRAQAAVVTGAGDASVEGSVRDVAAKIDSATRLGVVYIGLPGGSGLRPGMFARVAITVDTHEALTIPEQALVWPNGKPAAFVLQADNTAILKTVATGARHNGRVSIAAGLSDADRVAVAGAGFLRDGDTVRVEAASAGEAGRVSVQ